MVSVEETANKWLARHNERAMRWRHDLHAHPELSNEEHRTTQLLVDVLRAEGLDPVRFPHTGLYVDLGPTKGERVAFRADIDALPIQEITGLSYASTTPHVMHACGHDLHTTIVLALACVLAQADLPVGVRLIFQPAEETVDGGAEDIIRLGVLNNVAAIFAVHAEPKLRVGKIGVRAGAITSATDMVHLTVSGPGGHSSRPHLTADVVYAMGRLVTELPGLLSRRVDPRTGTVMVFGQVNAGNAPNAIPEQGTLSGTLRTADIGVWRSIRPLFEDLVHQIVAPTGCRVDIDYQRGVPPVLNDDAATALLADAATTVDPHAVVEAPQSSGGEDFSWYLEQVPGSMARLGCWDGRGKPQDLHQGDLVVDDRAIAAGVRLFSAVIDKYAAMAR